MGTAIRAGGVWKPYWIDLRTRNSQAMPAKKARPSAVIPQGPAAGIRVKSVVVVSCGSVVVVVSSCWIVVVVVVVGGSVVVVVVS